MNGLTFTFYLSTISCFFFYKMRCIYLLLEKGLLQNNLLLSTVYRIWKLSSRVGRRNFHHSLKYSSHCTSRWSQTHDFKNSRSIKSELLQVLNKIKHGQFSMFKSLWYLCQCNLPIPPPHCQCKMAFHSSVFLKFCSI